MRPTPPRPRWLPRLLAGVLLLGPLVLASPARGEDEAAFDYKAAKAAYDRWQERPSLYMRHKGRVEFAETHDVRAFRVLAKSYTRPEVPKDQVRYLLASLCGDNFRAPPHLETWRAWRAKHRKPRDAWLWYRALEAEIAIDGTAEAVAVAGGRGAASQRAAALEALIAHEDPAALTIAAGWLAALPSGAFDRMLLVESAAEALHGLATQRGTDAWKGLLELLRGQLDAAATSERTRRVLLRRLRRLDGALPPQEASRYAPPVKPTFLGIEADGARVVYVIDMSDSMLRPLTAEEVEDLKKPSLPAPARPGRVVTGGDGDAPAAPAPSPAAKRLAGAIAKLPWDRIRTRFDAARAFVQLSLRGLATNQEFCVIGFGTEARPLDATPGMRAATERNVEKACVELERIEPGTATRDRPHGTLWGYTNLHGGLHRAFKVRGRGLVKEDEFVEPDTFTEGADVVFLLSDGKPTWDDWPAWDTRLAEHASGDPESGAEVRDHEKGHYYGPYALASWLRDDLRRLNLFRKAEVHCVGIGEHDPHLLRWIAARGLGRFRRIPAAD